MLHTAQFYFQFQLICIFAFRRLPNKRTFKTFVCPAIEHRTIVSTYKLLVSLPLQI